MKRTLSLVLGLLIAAVSMTSVNGYAQERRPDPARVAELRGRIEQAKREKLQNALGLDRETAPKFFEHYNKAERELEMLHKQRREEVQKVADLVKGAGRDGDVDPAMNRVRELNKQIEQRRLQLDEEVRPILSPRQRAKLLMFEQQFANQLRRHRMEQMDRRDGNGREREEGRGGQMGKPPGRGPGDDDRGGKGPRGPRPHVGKR